jgi:hypothetical protein
MLANIRFHRVATTDAHPGAIPMRLATLRQNVKRYILPPRRKRTYPRAVKIKVSQYAHKERPVVTTK